MRIYRTCIEYFFSKLHKAAMEIIIPTLGGHLNRYVTTFSIRILKINLKRQKKITETRQCN